MALNKLALIVAVSSLMGVAMAARELQLIPAGHNIAARLQSGGNMECWNALLQLQSCTNEVILFFLNGETSLGVDCCRAIRVITHQCWPAMLTSLGFTLQEGDILRGFCDASTGSPLPFAPPPATTFQ